MFISKAAVTAELERRQRVYSELERKFRNRSVENHVCCSLMTEVSEILNFINSLPVVETGSVSKVSPVSGVPDDDIGLWINGL